MVQEKQTENEQALVELEQLKQSLNMQTVDKENLAAAKDGLLQENQVLKEQMQIFKEKTQKQEKSQKQIEEAMQNKE